MRSLEVADVVCSCRDHVCHFIEIQFVLCCLGGIPLEMAYCRAHTCVLWRLASGEIVVGENRLWKFCDVILASQA